MSGRALYLAAGIPWRVTLDDGVALRVETPGRARSLYPLDRLSRVQSGAQAQWASEALLACLRAGVPIVFHDTRGEAVGWCFGPRRREATLAQLLREAVREPQWPDVWRAWQQQAGRREARRLQRQLGLHAAQGCDAPGMHVRLCNLHRRRLGVPAAPWLRALRRAVQTLAAQVCADLVDAPELLGYPSPGTNLPATVAELMQCRLHAALLAWPTSTTVERAPGLLAAQTLEARGAELYRGCAELLGDLERVLREWLL
jgi:hypothetical protein